MYQYPHRFKCMQYIRKPDEIGKMLHLDAEKSKEKLARTQLNLEDFLNKDLKILHVKKTTRRDEILGGNDNDNIQTFLNSLADGQHLEDNFIKFHKHQNSHRIEIDEADQELKEGDDDFVYADDKLVRI